MSNDAPGRKWLWVALQVLAWVVLFSLPFLLRPSGGDRPPEKSGEHAVSTYYVVNNLFWILIFYMNALVLIPRLLYRRKLVYYILSLVLAYFLYVFIGWVNHLIFQSNGRFHLGLHAMFTFFIFLFMVAVSTALRMGIDRMRAEKLADEKMNENLKTELSLLRSQVSPHFMFNVLNNMVALARKKSDLLEPSLIKLSSLMRYMLYDIDGEKVSLDKEIEYLESYIDLQRQRVSRSVSIHTDFSDVDRGYELEPMLLIPFVENAFKHGTGMIEHPAIDIVLRARNQLLEFTVSNKFREDSAEVKDRTSGIGLTNVKRRLNLLYGKSHTLNVKKENDTFTIQLTLQLK